MAFLRPTGLLLSVLLACGGALPAQAQSGAAPTITNFSPASGPVGTTVVITGTNFVAPLSIIFGGTVQAGGSFTSTQITVTVPSGAQTGRIEVTTSGGAVTTATNFTIGSTSPPSFFDGEVALSNGVYYLSFPGTNYFGYYSFLSDPRYIYHFDLGYEYVFDAADGRSGIYLYDFKTQTYFYTSPTFPFPYLYDFGLNTVLYYYPSPNSAGHYNTNGVRYFYNFATKTVISL